MEKLSLALFQKMSVIFVRWKGVTVGFEKSFSSYTAEETLKVSYLTRLH